MPQALAQRDDALSMTVLSPNRELLLQVAQQLPASPQVLLQLNELLTDVNSGLDDIALLLRRDTALAARIIRISNSVAFGMCGRVATIEEAVNRVGFAEIYRLTGLASAAQLGDMHLTLYGITGPQLRDNTLVTALAAEALATRAGQDSRISYTAGLLRSSGKLVLDRYARRVAKSCLPFPQSGAGNTVTWEQTNFGCSNVEVAETVLSSWRFPKTIVEPVRHHLSDTVRQTDNGMTTALLHLACGIAHDSGFGLVGEHECWSQPPEMLNFTGLTPSLVTEAAEEARIGFEAVKGSL